MSSTDIRLFFNEDIGPKKKLSADAFLQGKYCSCPSLVPTVKISEAITNCIDLGRPTRGDTNNNSKFTRARFRNTGGYMFNRKQNDTSALSRIVDNEHELMEDNASSQSSSSSEIFFPIWNRSFSVPEFLPDHTGKKHFEDIDATCKSHSSASWPELSKVKNFIEPHLEGTSSDEDELDI